MEPFQSVPSSLTQLLYDSKLANNSDDFNRKYLGHIPTKHIHSDYSNDEYGRDMLRQDISRVNSNLDALGVNRMGDLLSPSMHDAEMTIAAVKELINQKNRDLESRNQISLRLKKLENERQDLTNIKEKWSTERQNLEQDKERLTKKIRDIDSAHKEAISKLTQERDDLAKQLAKSQGKEQQFKNEMKKRDQTITQLQESIRKMQGDKSIQYKNSFEVVQELEQTGPFLYYVNAEHQFGQLVQKNYEETYERLCGENKYYRECLAAMYRQLSEVLEFRKQLLIRRRGVEGEDSGDISSMNLSTFRAELLNMPAQNSRQAVELLDDNVKKFKEFMERMDVGNGEELRGCTEAEADRLKSVKNVKGLLKKYRYIVETQDGMLNRLVLRAKDLKMNEIATNDLKPSRGMDDQQLDKAKRFLQQQKNYLESKTKQIEVTKRAMAGSLRKLEQQKSEMQRKRKEFEQEGSKLKKQIELLPTHFDKEG